MADIYTAKRLGWNEGEYGNITRIDILDPYDYENDDLRGELVTRFVNTDEAGPYTQHLVNGQLADPDTIVKV